MSCDKVKKTDERSGENILTVVMFTLPHISVKTHTLNQTLNTVEPFIACICCSLITLSKNFFLPRKLTQNLKSLKTHTKGRNRKEVSEAFFTKLLEALEVPFYR